MLDNVIDTIPSLQAVKTQANRFKTHTVTALTYDQYSELLILDAITHDNKLKWDSKFGYKSLWNVYDLEHIPIDYFKD